MSLLLLLRLRCRALPHDGLHGATALLAATLAGAASAAVVVPARSHVPCLDVPTVWAAPGEKPVVGVEYAVVDHNRYVLLRGRTNAQGIAHLCGKALPADAAILLNPERNSAPPSPIFEKVK